MYGSSPPCAHLPRVKSTSWWRNLAAWWPPNMLRKLSSGFLSWYIQWCYDHIIENRPIPPPWFKKIFPIIISVIIIVLSALWQSAHVAQWWDASTRCLPTKQFSTPQKYFRWSWVLKIIQYLDWYKNQEIKTSTTKVDLIYTHSLIL